MICAACGQQNPSGFKFCGGCGAPLADEEPRRETRKVVTIVFCDLTGSTALGDVTDPEALRTTMRGYYEQMRAILERHGGTVEKFVGDAVMAVFGVPVSYEDDALRAVRAAWEMRDAIPALGLRARIGVNTGEVVAGDGDSLVTGDAVNVAARLEQAAEPGDVLIGAETRSLVRDAVRVEPVDVHAKGKPEPVRAFRLLDVDPEAAAIARRLDTPLVGRREELEQLRQAFERAVREKRCHLFTLLGAAGVGKSRLVGEFLSGVDARVLEGRCLDYGEGITYWPVISVLKQLGERAEATLTKVVEGGTLPNEVPWAVRTLLEDVAGERPLIVVFDDIQWGEETFLDLVDHIADMSRGAPILLLCVARPDLLDKRPGWGGGKLNVSGILLAPLSPDECAELISVHGGVEPEMAKRILSAAEGNPLFVEEMVALAHEDGDVRVPGTVQALLQARIDQLGGAERAVIERGAVEGQIFHRGAVAELARPTEVDPELAGLVRKELIQPAPSTLPRDQAFRFRHLLIRDAAYDALPKESRADLHERFADWLLEHGTALIELDEIAGYHLEQAALYHAELGHPRPDLGTRAGERLAAAGRRAAERGDVPGAEKLLRRASAFDAVWERAMLDRLTLLLPAPTVEREEVLAALEASGDERLQMHARIARLTIAVLEDPVDIIERTAAATAEALELFARHGDEAGIVATWMLRASVSWLRSRAGDTVAAIDEADRHAAQADMIDFKGRTDVLRFGPIVHGPFTTAELRERAAQLPPDSHQRVLLLAEIARFEGRYDEALAMSRALEELLLPLGAPTVVLPSRVARAEFLSEAGRAEEARAAWHDVVDELRALEQASFLSTALVDFGVTLADLGELEAADRHVLEGQAMGSPDDTINFVRGDAVRARIAADLGEHERALELAQSSVERVRDIDFPNDEAVALESLGYAHRAAGRAAEARAAYEGALAVWERYGRTANAARVRELLVEL